MALTSTLGSPGIEIREVDKSIRLDSNTATTIFVPGFASQGPVDEVMSIGTISDFETIYGVPTNAAERYFYYTVKAILDNSGNGATLLCSRLPYGTGKGDTVSNAYTMLAYPAVPVVKHNNGTKDTPEYVDFDQYRFTSTDDSNLIIESFKTTSKKVPVIEEYYITVDDNKITSSKLNITSIGTNVSIPPVGALISTEASGFDTESFLAPEISLDYGNMNFRAKGLIALELIDKKYYLHASYTICTVEDEPQPCGSIYLKLSYNENVEGQTIKGGSSIISLTFKEAFEIAKSYDGQKNDQSSENPNEFTNEITYVVGSPITYQISLQEYYKIITGESLKWSRKPYIFTDNTNSNTTVSEGDDEDDTFKSEAKFGNFDAIGHAAFITINTSRSIINNNFEGYYLGITDNMFITPSDDYTFNAVETVKITTETYDHDADKKVGLIDKVDNSGNFQSINENRLSFYTNTNHQGSLSKVLTRDITSMDTSATEYDDTISMGLFKLTKATDNTDILKLNFSLREKYNWSFGKTRLKSVNGSTVPVSYFVENVVEPSSNLTVLMNPYIANKGFIDTDGFVHGKIRVLGNKLLGNLEHFERKYLLRNYTDINKNTINQKHKSLSAMIPAKLAYSSINSWKNMIKQAGVTPKFIKDNFKNSNMQIGVEDTDSYYNFHPLNSIMPFGTYTSIENTNKVIGELPYKIERALSLVKNDEQYPDIDIILEGGLGTIYVNSMSEVVTSETAGNYMLLSESGNSTINGEGDREIYNLFDETRILQGMEDLRTGRTSLSEDAQEVVNNYRAIQSVFTSFANSM